MKEAKAKKMEAGLKRSARKKFGSTTSERARAYVYGAKRKAGWKPKRERRAARRGR